MLETVARGVTGNRQLPLVPRHRTVDDRHAGERPVEQLPDLLETRGVRVHSEIGVARFVERDRAVSLQADRRSCHVETSNHTARGTVVAVDRGAIDLDAADVRVSKIHAAGRFDAVGRHTFRNVGQRRLRIQRTVEMTLQPFSPECGFEIDIVLIAFRGDVQAVVHQARIEGERRHMHAEGRRISQRARGRQRHLADAESAAVGRHVTIQQAVEPLGLQRRHPEPLAKAAQVELVNRALAPVRDVGSGDHDSPCRLGRDAHAGNRRRLEPSGGDNCRTIRTGARLQAAADLVRGVEIRRRRRHSHLRGRRRRSTWRTKPCRS